MYRLHTSPIASAPAARVRRTRRALVLVSPFLAYLAALTAAHAQSAQTFGGGDDGALEQVTVTGDRLSQERAIEIQKNAPGVISAISADDLGKFADSSVADVIARVPGVSVVNNQESGEGEYVTVRSLSAGLNAYSINGVNVANTDPSNRAVSLLVLPPNGLQSIVVSKTGSPDLDGDFIGGSIDFRTPTAFDYDKPIARVFANYGLNSRSLDQHEPPGAAGIQADYGDKFGPGRNFGFFVTGYYNYMHTISEETENDGEWEPYNYRATPTEAIDGRSLYLPGIDLDYRRIKETRWGGDFSLDYQTGDQSLYVRGQYAKFNRVEDHNYFTIGNNETARLQQVNPDDTSLQSPDNSITGVTDGGDKIYNYTPSQIIDQNGDGIITDADRTGESYWSLLGKSGTWNPQGYYMERSYETDNEVQDLGTIDAGGSSRFGQLKLDYDAAYSFGKNGNPADYEVDFETNDDAAPFNTTGVSFTSFDPRFPLWQLPAYAKSTPSDNSLFLQDGASHETEMTEDKHFSAKVDATYGMGGTYSLDYLKAGFKYQLSDRKHDETDIYDDDLPFDTLADASSLISRNVDTILHGTYPFGPIFDMKAVESTIDALGTETFSDDDQNGSDYREREAIYAGYAMANFKYNDLEVIAGVRVEFTDVNSTFWAIDTVSHWASADNSYTEVLPSITLNYRPSKDIVYRAAIWTGFSRPEYGYISGATDIEYNPDGTIASISQGNPNLKPVESTNFDLSAEYYADTSSVFAVSAFYKSIRNFIFIDGSSVNFATPRGGYDFTQPKNGGPGRVYGVEFNAIKTFSELPVPLDGFGIAANVTLQNSSADTGEAYREGHEIPLIDASKIMFNLALDYQKYGFEGRISYGYRSKYIEELRDNAIDKWVQPNGSLDFHSRYSFDNGLSADFDISNLLDTWKYYTTKGPSPAYQKDYMEPGRVYMLKLAYSY